jgi:phospholipase C
MSLREVPELFVRFTAAVMLSACLAGCGLGGVESSFKQSGPPLSMGKIQHVIIIVQENRTVDNLFNGLPGADTTKVGVDHNGDRVRLHQVDLASYHDPCHSHTCWLVTYDGGKLDGFDFNNPGGTGRDYDYAFVNPAEIGPYFALAKRYTFADRMFQSNYGPSFPAHLYLVAGQSALVDENPIQPRNDAWGCDSPPSAYTLVLGPDGQDHRGPFPCFDFATLADTMDQAGISWRYYAPSIGSAGAIWSAFDAVRHIRFGPDWNGNVISPETRVLSDIAAGSLAQVTWIIPKGVNSDHPHTGGRGGPQWVASIVNAVGQSQFWNSTAIFITWDDWGGWFDHVQPPQLDAMGLGYRVPLVVVSPYARLEYVSHVSHEFGSIMKFTEENFGLASLGLIDSRADDLIDCFNFSQQPTPFVYVPTSVPQSFFVNQPPSSAPPDSD